MPKDEILDGLVDFSVAGPTIFEEETEEIEKVAATDDIPDEDPELEETTNEEEDNAVAAFSLFKEFGVIDDDDIPEQQTVEAFRELGSKLGEKYLEKAIESSPPIFKDVLIFAHSKDNPTRQDLLNFLKIDEDSPTLPVVENVDEAEDFLRNELSNHRLYKDSPTALQLYLDGLEDDQKLRLAKSLLKDREEEVTKSKQAAIDAAKYEKEQNLKGQQEFVANLNKAIDDSGWSKRKQEEVREVTGKIQDINKSITSDPALYAQYLNFLSTFDFNTKQFDTSKYDARNNTKKVNGIKDSIIADSLSSTIAKISGKANKAGNRDSLIPA